MSILSAIKSLCGMSPERERLLSPLGYKFSSAIQGVYPEAPNESRGVSADSLHGMIQAAEQGDTTRLFAFYRDIILTDSHIQTEFGKRIIAVLGDDLVVNCEDKSNPIAGWIKEQIETQLKSLGAGVDELLKHMLFSTIYPVSVAEIIYKKSHRAGWLYEVDKFVVIPHTNLDYTSPDHVLRVSLPHCTGEFLTPDVEGWILHRGSVFSSFSDYLGGPMRSILFWYLFSTQTRDWWAQFLNKWGNPFLIGKYDKNDASGKLSLANAFANARRLFGIVTTSETDVKVEQISSSSADSFERFKTFSNAEISKVILGQTMSSTAQNVGLGGGQASVQEEVRQDIRQYDSKQLAQLLRASIFQPLCRLNGWDVELCPSFSFGGVSTAEKSSIVELLGKVKAGGLQLTEDAIGLVSEQLGIGLERAPEVGDSATPYPLNAVVALSAGELRTRRVSPAERRKLSEIQLQKASDALLAEALEPFVSALGKHYEPIAKALSASSSKAEFLRALGKIEFEDNAAAVAVLEDVLASASANGILSVNSSTSPNKK